MPGIGTKVVHVFTNNLRRHRYRLAGGASVLTVVVCLTLLLGPRFDGRILQGRGEEGGLVGDEDTEEEIQLQLPGSVVAASLRGELPAEGLGASKRVTGPQGQPSGRSSYNDTLSPKVQRESPSAILSSGRLDPRQTPSRQKGTQSPYNPCIADTFPKRPPDDLVESFEWQRVSGDTTNTYVFSAHYDPRDDRRTVFIVGISSDYMSASVNYACQIWFAKTETAEVTKAEIYTHSETHGRKYAPTFYTCNYHSNESLPFAVSLVIFESRCRSPSNVLRISPFDRSNGPEVNFTVCVTPLNYDFDDFRLLVEMVELNRMFGAQRVVFYNFTTGSHVVPYLRSYAQDGVVTVVPWKLPVVTDVQGGSATEPEIHYFGQVAALNDCIYRNMFRSRFVVLTDLDEIVVPRRHGTWIEMMEREGRGRQNGIASFHVRNVFFRTDYGQDELYSGNASVRGLQLRSLLFTTREATTFPHGWRSKHIVNPEAVLLVGVHHIESMLDFNRFSVLDVDESAAILHHYRSWADVETSRQISRPDRYMHSFNQSILSRVVGVHQTVASRFKGVATLEELKTNRTQSSPKL